MTSLMGADCKKKTQLKSVSVLRVPPAKEEPAAHRDKLGCVVYLCRVPHMSTLRSHGERDSEEWNHFHAGVTVFTP
jgi:hypothetical protein